MKQIFLILTFLSTISLSHAYQIVSPIKVKQGDPLHIFILGDDSGRIVQIQFKNEKVWPFILEHKPHAIFGISLNEKLGKQTLYFTDIKASSTITRTVEVVARLKPSAQFSIPHKLGGDTKKGESIVSKGIEEENEILKNLPQHSKRFWNERFSYPLTISTVTDAYGYSRVTGKTVIAHKGTDFRATLGTPVYAMNRGMVQVTKKFTLYGNTVIIDHGEGISTLYMHLRNSLVKESSMVEKGELIGYSGQTGYANGPHLHVSVKVSKQSIDPLLFMKYVGSRYN